MQLNPEIQKILTQYKINVNEGTLFLLAVYHNLDVNRLVNEETWKRINITKIVQREFTGNTYTLKWNVNLYNVETQDDNWSWIEPWREMFGSLRADAIGVKQACYSKMKAYFASHPEVRKDDVLAATERYIRPFRLGRNQITMLQRADYFISKLCRSSEGTEFSSRLDMYLEILRKEKEQAQTAQAKHISDRYLGQTE